jgi:hypothetical protein
MYRSRFLPSVVRKIMIFNPFDRMSGIRSASASRPTCMCRCPPLAGLLIYVSLLSGRHQTALQDYNSMSLWLISNTRGVEINRRSSNRRARLGLYVSFLSGLHQTHEDSRLIGEVSTAVPDYNSMSLSSLAYIKHTRTLE